MAHDCSWDPYISLLNHVSLMSKDGPPVKSLLDKESRMSTMIMGLSCQYLGIEGCSTPCFFYRTRNKVQDLLAREGRK